MEQTEKIIKNIKKVIIGKETVIKQVLTVVLADGHVLLEDVPGTGKTKLAKSLAVSLGVDFGRIQFTPDMLPADITGLHVFNRETGDFELKKGPVFTNILLADEINRATPRTQAGLLECMEERQVTIDGKTLPLSELFFVIATQNPVETAGTFPLPEAQMDRFLMRISMGMPERDEELAILHTYKKEDPLESLSAVVNAEDIFLLRKKAKEVFIHPAVEEYLVDIVRATRGEAPYGNDKIRMGVSPRGTLALMRCARAYACLEGRDYCVPDDIKALAVPVLAHRLVLSYGQNGYRETAAVVKEILQQVPVPTEDFCVK